MSFKTKVMNLQVRYYSRVQSNSALVGHLPFTQLIKDEPWFNPQRPI